MCAWFNEDSSSQQLPKITPSSGFMLHDMMYHSGKSMNPVVLAIPSSGHHSIAPFAHQIPEGNVSSHVHHSFQGALHNEEANIQRDCHHLLAILKSLNITLNVNDFYSSFVKNEIRSGNHPDLQLQTQVSEPLSDNLFAPSSVIPMHDISSSPMNNMTPYPNQIPLKSLQSHHPPGFNNTSIATHNNQNILGVSLNNSNSNTKMTMKIPAAQIVNGTLSSGNNTNNANVPKTTTNAEGNYPELYGNFPDSSQMLKNNDFIGNRARAHSENILSYPNNNVWNPRNGNNKNIFIDNPSIIDRYNILANSRTHNSCNNSQKILPLNDSGNIVFRNSQGTIANSLTNSSHNQFHHQPTTNHHLILSNKNQNGGYETGLGHTNNQVFLDSTDNNNLISDNINSSLMVASSLNQLHLQPHQDHHHNHHHQKEEEEQHATASFIEENPSFNNAPTFVVSSNNKTNINNSYSTTTTTTTLTKEISKFPSVHSIANLVWKLASPQSLFRCLRPDMKRLLIPSIESSSANDISVVMSHILKSSPHALRPVAGSSALNYFPTTISCSSLANTAALVSTPFLVYPPGASRPFQVVLKVIIIPVAHTSASSIITSMNTHLSGSSSACSSSFSSGVLNQHQQPLPPFDREPCSSCGDSIANIPLNPQSAAQVHKDLLDLKYNTWLGIYLSTPEDIGINFSLGIGWETEDQIPDNRNTRWAESASINFTNSLWAGNDLVMPLGYTTDFESWCSSGNSLVLRARITGVFPSEEQKKAQAVVESKNNKTVPYRVRSFLPSSTGSDGMDLMGLKENFSTIHPSSLSSFTHSTNHVSAVNVNDHSTFNKPHTPTTTINRNNNVGNNCSSSKVNDFPLQNLSSDPPFYTPSFQQPSVGKD